MTAGEARAALKELKQDDPEHVLEVINLIKSKSNTEAGLDE